MVWGDGVVDLTYLLMLYIVDERLPTRWMDWMDWMDVAFPGGAKGLYDYGMNAFLREGAWRGGREMYVRCMQCMHAYSTRDSGRRRF